jgi:hypothetical protein
LALIGHSQAFAQVMTFKWSSLYDVLHVFIFVSRDGDYLAQYVGCDRHW